MKFVINGFVLECVTVLTFFYRNTAPIPLSIIAMNRLVHAISFGVVAAIGLIILIVAIATVSWVVVVEDDVGASNSVTPGKRVRQVGLFQVCTEGSCKVDGKTVFIITPFFIFDSVCLLKRRPTFPPAKRLNFKRFGCQ